MESVSSELSPQMDHNTLANNLATFGGTLVEYLGNVGTGIGMVEMAYGFASGTHHVMLGVLSLLSAERAIDRQGMWDAGRFTVLGAAITAGGVAVKKAGAAINGPIVQDAVSDLYYWANPSAKKEL